MLFILRKSIEALLVPVGLCSFLILAGLVLRRRILSLAGVLLLIVLSMPVASHMLMRPLENTYPPKAIAAAPQADAIVALSGGVVKLVNPIGTEWGESSNRYFTAYNLAMAGKAKWLIFTAATNDPKAPSEGALERDAAIRGGVKPESILLTGRVLTTEDEAREVSKMSGIHSILLVTSALHMPRAVLLFRARGLDVSPFPTDQKTMSPGSLAMDSIPNAHGLLDSEEAMREYYGLTIYKTLFLFHPLGNLRR